MWDLKLAPVHGGQGDTKEGADHSRLVGGRFNKQGNLHTRIVLGGCKTSGLPHLPPGILKVYIEALIGFSHVRRPDGLNSTGLCRVSVIGNDSHCGNSRQGVPSKDREGVRRLCPEGTVGVHWGELWQSQSHSGWMRKIDPKNPGRCPNWYPSMIPFPGVRGSSNLAGLVSQGFGVMKVLHSWSWHSSAVWPWEGYLTLLNWGFFFFLICKIGIYCVTMFSCKKCLAN